jgi:hypothetical protein
MNTRSNANWDREPTHLQQDDLSSWAESYWVPG